MAPATSPQAGCLMTGDPPGVAGSVARRDGDVVVTMAGDVDLATLPKFTALLDEALAAGADRVTIDVTNVTFLDGRGLTVLLTAAQRLRSVGGHLTVRGARPRIRWLFEITGLTDALGVQAAARRRANPHEPAALTAWPAVRVLLEDALRMVVSMAQTVVAAADGASITLPDHGRFGTAAASNDVVLNMDQDQYATGEGPCLDAASLGERFHIPSLTTELRWPQFVPRARARGIASILSTPMIAGDRPLGALNIYSRTVGAFAEHEMAWADEFAAQAAEMVYRGRADT